jgi:hypothetical protein
MNSYLAEWNSAERGAGLLGTLDADMLPITGTHTVRHVTFLPALSGSV